MEYLFAFNFYHVPEVYALDRPVVLEDFLPSALSSPARLLSLPAGCGLEFLKTGGVTK